MSYLQLQTKGFLFTQTSVAVAVATADFGDGFDAGALIGSAEGLRAWNVKIDVLPDSSNQAPLVDGKTRANYLWDFFLTSKAAGDRPFWIEDVKDGKFYLASFTEHTLSYDVLCSKAYSTGLSLRQRRARDQASPVEALP
jgi:hypothetical protein